MTKSKKYKMYIYDCGCKSQSYIIKRTAKRKCPKHGKILKYIEKICLSCDQKFIVSPKSSKSLRCFDCKTLLQRKKSLLQYHKMKAKRLNTVYKKPTIKSSFQFKKDIDSNETDLNENENNDDIDIFEDVDKFIEKKTNTKPKILDDIVKKNNELFNQQPIKNFKTFLLNIK